MKENMQVIFRNGETWSIPVMDIAMNRAEYYAHEFDGDVQRSLNEDTIPLFEDDFEIEDWAKNCMNWEDFNNKTLVESKFDYQDHFGNADVEIK